MCGRHGAECVSAVAVDLGVGYGVVFRHSECPVWKAHLGFRISAAMSRAVDWSE